MLALIWRGQHVQNNISVTLLAILDKRPMTQNISCFFLFKFDLCFWNYNPFSWIFPVWNVPRLQWLPCKHILTLGQHSFPACWVLIGQFKTAWACPSRVSLVTIYLKDTKETTVGDKSAQQTSNGPSGNKKNSYCVWLFYFMHYILVSSTALVSFSWIAWSSYR